MTMKCPACIVRKKLREHAARNWTISDKMIRGWLVDALGREPTDVEHAQAVAEYSVEARRV
jgi:hypothetical protein